jgi:hypothetical protein
MRVSGSFAALTCTYSGATKAMFVHLLVDAAILTLIVYIVSNSKIKLTARRAGLLFLLFVAIFALATFGIFRHYSLATCPKGDSRLLLKSLFSH